MLTKPQHRDAVIANSHFVGSIINITKKLRKLLHVKNCFSNLNFDTFLIFMSDDLVAICKEYHAKVFKLEGDKWDLERGIKIRLLEVMSSCPLAAAA